MGGLSDSSEDEAPAAKAAPSNGHPPVNGGTVAADVSALPKATNAQAASPTKAARAKLFCVAVPSCLVRMREDLKSAEVGRLQEGAVVKCLDQSGARLRFQKVSGEGPTGGWLSVVVGGKQTLCD